MVSTETLIKGISGVGVKIGVGVVVVVGVNVGVSGVGVALGSSGPTAAVWVNAPDTVPATMVLIEFVFETGVAVAGEAQAITPRKIARIGE